MGCLQSLCAKPQVVEEDDFVDSLPMGVPVDDLEAKVENEKGTKVEAVVTASKRFKPMDDPEAFYSQFDYKFQEPTSTEDKALLSREEKPEDRILDLLLIMDCTSSMSFWLDLCKVSH